MNTMQKCISFFDVVPFDLIALSPAVFKCLLHICGQHNFFFNLETDRSQMGLNPANMVHELAIPSLTRKFYSSKLRTCDRVRNKIFFFTSSGRFS